MAHDCSSGKAQGVTTSCAFFLALIDLVLKSHYNPRDVVTFRFDSTQNFD
jgi:hypothetical protein